MAETSPPMRLLFIALLAVACTPTLKSYKPGAMARDEGAVVGRVKVVYNGSDLTSKCGLCFRSVNGPCYKLDESGYVAMALKAGNCSIRRIVCNVDGERHFHFKGYRFEVSPAVKTYFGDVKVEWKNEQGFKPSQLFGAVGAIVDQSINDGEANLSVADSRAETVAWYDSYFKQQDGVQFRDSVVAFTEASPMPTAESCAPMLPALLADNAEVRKEPEAGSLLVASVPEEAAACVGATTVGFGFRRVKGKGFDGYVADTFISKLGR
jgi:hypothetical protein